MKKIIMTTAFTIILLNVFSQNIVYGDTIIPLNKNLRYYNIFDTLEVKCLSNPQKKSYIFVNNKAVDSTGIKPVNIPLLNSGKIYFNYKVYNSTLKNKLYKDLKKITYSIKTQKTEKFNYRFECNILNYDKFYVLNENATGIYIVNIGSGEKTLLFDLIDFVSKDEDGYPAEQASPMYFIDNNKVLIELCYYGEMGPGCEDNRFFIVENKKLFDVTEKIKLKYYNKNFQNFYSKIEYISKDRKFIKEKAELSRLGPGDDSIRCRIFDTNLNFISDILVTNDDNYLMGVNIQNDNIQNYFLRSFTDNEEEVIIPYEFVPDLEIAMYNIYNNKIIEKSKISNLDIDQLQILKNMIFAKHNYKFDNKYYQAYFNLYEFYLDRRKLYGKGLAKYQEQLKTRTKKVNHLLTETDKQNLKLIKKAIKQKN